ncbi:MAG: hypothetical protein AMJ79_08810 [Phycisphaerae bacterium SM23_30]|nr:MAG: hypothetical protein AMJ79_08810 [Phycisphaerae bacterium SM23_30]
MADLNVIKEIAEQVLAIPTVKGIPDRYLIDRAYRILRHCGNIAQLNEVRRFQIDHPCLNVAVLFHDAGFACYANQADRAARMVLADLNDRDIRDFSTQVIHEKLSELLNPRQMERVCSIIAESGSRSTYLIEAMILSDARNLDDMGAVGLFNEMRRYVVHGYGATEALASWKRKIDYDYWTARLRESFRFDSVRNIARKRLQIAEQFMAQLHTENRAGDLEDLLLEQQLAPSVNTPIVPASPCGHTIEELPALPKNRRQAKTCS